MTGLVLSGGGSKGAFQVGALDYILNHTDIKFDCIDGVSTGSLQGSMVATDQFAYLKNMWLSIKKDSDIVKHSWWKLMFLKFPYSFTGLEGYLKYALKTGYKIPFFCGVVNLDTTKYRSIRNPNYREILASCSIPVLFEPVYYYEKPLVDGGLRNVTPLKDAIDRGCDKIIVITCGNRKDELPFYPQEKYNVKDALFRTLDIMVHEIKLNDFLFRDITQAEKINTWVENGFEKYRKIDITVIEPQHKYTVNMDSLKFDPTITEALMNHGFNQAMEVLK